MENVSSENDEHDRKVEDDEIIGPAEHI